MMSRKSAASDPIFRWQPSQKTTLAPWMPTETNTVYNGMADAGYGRGLREVTRWPSGVISFAPGVTTRRE